MDNIIFERPIQRPPRLRKPLPPRVSSTEEMAARGNPLDSQQQECVQSPKPSDSDPNAIGSARSSELPTALPKVCDDQRIRSNDNTGDDGDTADGGLASLHDLFLLSEGDESSVDGNDGSASADDLFSPQEQNEQPADSDTSVGSAAEKLGDEIPPDHSAASDWTGRGDGQDQPIVLSDDESDSDIAKRFRFRQRKPKSDLGGFDTRIPLSLSGHDGVHGAKTDGKSQHNDEDVGTHDSAAIPHKRRRHGDRACTEGRHDDSLFDALSGDDNGSDNVEARGANRQTALNPLRRNAKNPINRISLQSKKRHRSVSSESSSSSDESNLSDSPMPPRERAAQSSSRRGYNSAHHSRRRRSPQMPSNGFPSERVEKTSPHNTSSQTSQYVYKKILGCREWDGRLEVKVLWPEQSSWEGAEGFPLAEVANAIRNSERRRAGKASVRRGKPPSHLVCKTAKRQ